MCSPSASPNRRGERPCRPRTTVPCLWSDPDQQLATELAQPLGCAGSWTVLAVLERPFEEGWPAGPQVWIGVL
jgi:hypothetical protein